MAIVIYLDTQVKLGTLLSKTLSITHVMRFVFFYFLRNAALRRTAFIFKETNLTSVKSSQTCNTLLSFLHILR